MDGLDRKDQGLESIDAIPMSGIPHSDAADVVRASPITLGVRIRLSDTNQRRPARAVASDQRSRCDDRLDHTLSITAAMPWPTPMHIVHSA